ncbi:hypothetical protein GCM10022247_44750 [Allokutzneria multivorans]|uniref:Uncharacterized protein n=1 Tax=Allokutzneria multivorans TaxID=1142134 RepID=A0ABP7SUS2_9PSEU
MRGRVPRAPAYWLTAPLVPSSTFWYREKPRLTTQKPSHRPRFGGQKEEAPLGGGSREESGLSGW